MTARNIRRAAERKANKLARKSAQLLAPTASIATATEYQFPCEQAEESESAAIEAPAKTTAPVIVSAAAANANLTSVMSPLTTQATLLPIADAALYNQLLCDYQAEYQPMGPQEFSLVQSLAEIVWRTRRMVTLEMSIFAKGRIEFAKQFAEHNPDLRESLIDVHTFLTYEKQIRGLQLQEARLSRRSDKACAELRELQKERRQREQLAHRRQQKEGQPFHPEQFGFEYSNHKIELDPNQKQPRSQQFSAPPSSPIQPQAA